MVAIASALALGACREAEPPAPREAEKPLLVGHEDNLLSLVRGAVVTHRTGEALLRASAAMAIDGDPLTYWATPPDDLEETMVVALPGPAEIRRIGISTGALRPATAAGIVRFDASTDGTTFVSLGEVHVEEKGETWIDVTPTRAVFVRATTIAPFRDGARSVRVADILAAGTNTDSASRPAIEGFWEINGMAAHFRSEGSTVRGLVAEREPMALDGAWQGRVIRLAWTRGAERGVAALGVDAASSHLNGVLWHVRSHRPFFWTTWFGQWTPGGDAPSGTPTDPMRDFLDAEGRYPLYALEFDGPRLRPGSEPAVERLAALIGENAPQRFRFVAYHAGMKSADEDMRLTEARLGALRDALRKAGADPGRAAFVPRGRAALVNADADELPWAPLHVLLNNRIDLELVRESRPDGGSS